MVFREDLSLRPGVDIPHMRYFEISRFHVKQGHDKDWEALAKMYQSGFEKNLGRPLGDVSSPIRPGRWHLHFFSTR